MNGVMATIIGTLTLIGGIVVIGTAAAAIMDAINDYYNR